MKFTASASRFADGRIGELFLDNHKAGSQIGTIVRDAAIAFSFAVQNGADAEAIRRALCRDSKGRALGPLGAALDVILPKTVATHDPKTKFAEAFGPPDIRSAAAAQPRH